MKQSTTKHCINCNIIKNIQSFYIQEKRKDGVYPYCKKCTSLKNNKYRRTKKGLVTKIYGDQKSNSVNRGYCPPTYTKIELSEWLFSQKKFHILYDNWKRLDYQKDYVPSVDRKDDYIGYTMDNIQLMTWKENLKKAGKDRKDGTSNKLNKTVYQYSKDGDFIDKYYSIHKAERVSGVDDSNISAVCKGNRKSAGGFVWSFTKH